MLRLRVEVLRIDFEENKNRIKKLDTKLHILARQQAMRCDTL